MSKVVIYSGRNCPYCDRAKALLDSKEISYQEIKIDEDEAKRLEMVELSGRRTVPQIFINNKPVGGFDDLWAFETKGELDQLLKD